MAYSSKNDLAAKAEVDKTKIRFVRYPTNQAIEVVRAEPPVSSSPSDVIIGAGEPRLKNNRRNLKKSRQEVLEQNTPVETGKTPWFSISFSTNPSKSPVVISLSKLKASLLLFCGLVILTLAVFSIISMVPASSTSANGDNIAWQNSAANREQQQQKLIDLQERRLSDMQEENNKRLLEISSLESQLQGLNDSIGSLKSIASQLQDMLGSSSTTGSQISPIASPGSTGTGSDTSLYIPPIRVQGGYLDVNQGRQYLNQFNDLLNKAGNLGQLIGDSKSSITEYTLQVSTYQQELLQQKSQLDAAVGNMTQLGNPDTLGDTDAPPNMLPWPGPLTSGYGWRLSPFRAGVREFHYGLDIGVPEGTPVMATKPGIVTYMGYDPGYGNMIEVTHSNGWLTRYGHNSKFVAKLGQAVKKGDIIALSGNTGASTGPHIHFEVHKNGVPLDPAPYIPSLKK